MEFDYSMNRGNHATTWTRAWARPRRRRERSSRILQCTRRSTVVPVDGSRCLSESSGDSIGPNPKPNLNPNHSRTLADRRWTESCNAARGGSWFWRARTGKKGVRQRNAALAARWPTSTEGDLCAKTPEREKEAVAPSRGLPERAGQWTHRSGENLPVDFRRSSCVPTSYDEITMKYFS